MTIKSYCVAEFPGHPVTVAETPTVEDVLSLLSHPQAYDAEGLEGQPALVLRGCVTQAGTTLIWIADQCTHSQMTMHLSGNYTGSLTEFIIYIPANYEVEIWPEDPAEQISSLLPGLLSQMTVELLKSRLGRFPRIASPRRRVLV